MSDDIGARVARLERAYGANIGDIHQFDDEDQAVEHQTELDANAEAEAKQQADAQAAADAAQAALDAPPAEPTEVAATEPPAADDGEGE